MGRRARTAYVVIVLLTAGQLAVATVVPIVFQ